MSLSRPVLLALALLGAGCASPRGDTQFDERCGGDRECQRGLCVGGVHGDAPVCTISCAHETECPQGWSCRGVTQDNVLVCAFGGATPFDPDAQH
ncbi:MAG: hypothetical protein M3Y87_14035 [Myxococcota bacterium]|nr:hypothetical protein [Myxococcota bacterium]